MRLYSFVLVLMIVMIMPPLTAHGEEQRPVLDQEEFPIKIESEYFERDHRLRVGVIPDLPPFQFIENNELVGFNIDLMNHIAKENNTELYYMTMTREKGIEAIQKGRIDILVGIPFTEEYNAKMEFTDSFITSSIGVLVPTDSDIENLSDLQEKVVALQLNTVEYDFIKNIRNVHVHVAHDQTVAVDVIKRNRADAFIGNTLTVEYLLKRDQLKEQYKMIENYLLPLDFSFVVDKENYSLLTRLNVGIRHFKLSNDYSTIYSKWFGKLETPAHKQLKLIRDTLIIIIAISAIVFGLVMRWNRSLQWQVADKTADLQVANDSLKEQKEIAEESDRIKEQILESSLRGVVTVNKEGIIITINTVATKIFGVEGHVIGRHIKDVFFDWKTFQDEINQVIKTKHSFKNEELDVTNYFDRIDYLSYDIQPFYNFAGEIVGALLFLEDVTEEKKLKEQLYNQEKSRALTQLVAGIAHEIRNPLTSIKTFVEMIPYKMDSKQFRDEIAIHVPKEIDRLNHLVEELIDYAKPKSDNKAIMNISSAVNFVILLFKNKVSHKGYDFITEVEEDIFIKGDENQIKQVLINLVLNAIESNDHKGHSAEDPLSVSVSLYSRHGQVFIDIKDEGIGMSSEMTERVFEPFYTTKPDGTGLGLALSRQFIIENDGTIHVESELNKYSKFQISFPIEEDINATRTNY